MADCGPVLVEPKWEHPADLRWRLVERNGIYLTRAQAEVLDQAEADFLERVTLVRGT